MKIGRANIPLKWNQLNILDFEVEIAVSALRQLNENQEESLYQTKKKFENFMESNRNAVESLPENEQASYDTHLHYYDEMMIEDLQRLQRYSIVITIFSFFESQLFYLCIKLNKEFPKVTQLHEIEIGEDLKKYWVYLSKNFCLDTTKLESLYQRFKQQKFLRNRIVHHNGILHINEGGKICRRNGVSLRKFGDEYLIEIEENIYVEYLLKYLRLFFRELTVKVDKRCKELKAKTSLK